MSAAGANGVASLLSTMGTHPMCFLAGTQFRCPRGVLVPIEGVQAGETLTGIDECNVQPSWSQVCFKAFRQNKEYAYTSQRSIYIDVYVDMNYIVSLGIHVCTH